MMMVMGHQMPAKSHSPAVLTASLNSFSFQCFSCCQFSTKCRFTLRLDAPRYEDSSQQSICSLDNMMFYHFWKYIKPSRADVENQWRRRGTVLRARRHVCFMFDPESQTLLGENDHNLTLLLFDGVWDFIRRDHLLLIIIFLFLNISVLFSSICSRFPII